METIIEKNERIQMDFVRSTDELINKAISKRASDIHIEPVANEKVRVRFRIDGVLENVILMSMTLYRGILTRIKVLAGMDIAESRWPQDGNIVWKHERCSGCRVSTMPTVFGEKVVIRLLSTSSQIFSLPHLGITDEQNRMIRYLTAKKQGMILICGPTGSGKTTTLYAILQDLSEKPINVVSLEDPVEIEIPEITQIRISEKRVNYECALSAVLRQDPDVIAIGELRNEKVARMAVRAAMTGHLVLSSLHTQSALESIIRLNEIRLPVWQIKSVLSGVIAQSLVRRICPRCKQHRFPTKEECIEWELDPEQEIFYGQGCSYCDHSGYYGRIGVFEVLVCDDHLKQCLYDGADIYELKRSVNAFQTMRNQVRQLIVDGVTTTEEGKGIV